MIKTSIGRQECSSEGLLLAGNPVAAIRKALNWGVPEWEEKHSQYELPDYQPREFAFGYSAFEVAKLLGLEFASSKQFWRWLHEENRSCVHGFVKTEYDEDFAGIEILRNWQSKPTEIVYDSRYGAWFPRKPLEIQDGQIWTVMPPGKSGCSLAPEIRMLLRDDEVETTAVVAQEGTEEEFTYEKITPQSPILFVSFFPGCYSTEGDTAHLIYYFDPIERALMLKGYRIQGSNETMRHKPYQKVGEGEGLEIKLEGYGKYLVPTKISELGFLTNLIFPPDYDFYLYGTNRPETSFAMNRKGRNVFDIRRVGDWEPKEV